MQCSGHSDIQTTANIYGHIDVQRKKELAEAISINPKKPKDDEADIEKTQSPVRKSVRKVLETEKIFQMRGCS